MTPEIQLLEIAGRMVAAYIKRQQEQKPAC